MAWDDAKKAKAVEKYLAGEPTGTNSTELCKEIAEELEESANEVRLILMQAQVYVKKDAAAAPAGKTASGEKKASTRVSKEDSINALKAAIKAAGKAVDDDILDKLTGKAAIYFTSLFAQVEAEEE